jgi:hypothetical protein
MIYDWYVMSSKEIGVRAVVKSGVPEVDKAAVRRLGLELWGGKCGVHVGEWSGVGGGWSTQGSGPVSEVESDRSCHLVYCELLERQS